MVFTRSSAGTASPATGIGPQEPAINRRGFVKSLAGLSCLALTGCVTTERRVRVTRQPAPKMADPYGMDYKAIYGPLPYERFPIPAVDISKVPRQFLRRRVDFPANYRPGTLIVDTSTFFLHLVEEGGTAMRYGVGLGRQGFAWSGEGVIQWKQEWPKWTPPDEMIARQPELEKYSAENGGMPPGLDNPLGARALYIFQNGEDTLYRVHGTREYWTIGKAVSSGCVRMMNQDVIDLYGRVRSGALIVVV